MSECYVSNPRSFIPLSVPALLVFLNVFKWIYIRLSSLLHFVTDLSSPQFLCHLLGLIHVQRWFLILKTQLNPVLTVVNFFAVKNYFSISLGIATELVLSAGSEKWIIFQYIFLFLDLLLYYLVSLGEVSLIDLFKSLPCDVVCG
jgi:hypothetical protein